MTETPEPGAPKFAHLISRLRFRHLRLLVELRRGGSLRAASSTLNLTQPALGKALDEIEQAFGFALFERGPRGLAPTPRGEVAIRGAALLLAELAHLGEEVAATEAPVLLRIGAPPFVAQSFLPPLLQRITEKDELVHVRLREAGVTLLFEALAAGELDALVSTYPADALAASARAFSYEKLFASNFVVAAPTGHPLASAREVSWQQLAGERWVLPPENTMLRRLLGDAFRREACVPPEPVVESANPYTNLQLVAAGAGLGAIPEAVWDSLAATLPIARVRVEPAIRANSVALIVRKGPANPRLRVLRWALGLQAD